MGIRTVLPQEIYIPGTINLHVTWKLWPWERWFHGHAEDVEVARTCIECGECEEKCPYHLPIREMLKEGIAFYERAVAEHDGRQTLVTVERSG